MIGIFGGTFNPIHLGHLRLALELWQQKKIKEIRFIPCAQPVHKTAPQISAFHRIAMLKLAIAQQPGFILDQREIHRNTPSYMVETLKSLHQDFPHQFFTLILGSDAAKKFTQWHQWQTILSLASLTIVPRHNDSLMQIPEAIRPYCDWQPLTTLPIASETIRHERQAGRSVRYWVPDLVWHYMEENQLYR